MKRFRVILALLLLSVSLPALAQRSATYTDFEDLRADGNGIGALKRQVTMAFDNEPASSALTTLALAAQISITFEATHVAFQAPLTIPAHGRSVAAALMEIGRICDARILVSRSGQIVLSPNEKPRPVARAPVRQDSLISRDKAYALPKMTVEGIRAERVLFDNSPQVSALTMSAEALRATPSFIEPDVLRSIQLLPGIEARSDWSAGFSVRGGEADQSLVLLDGYPIYNPYHLGGVFSTFIDPAVGSVSLYTGGLPTQLGGRLSGALDVSTARPTTSSVHGALELSLISSLASAGQLSTTVRAAGWLQRGARMPMSW